MIFFGWIYVRIIERLTNLKKRIVGIIPPSKADLSRSNAIKAAYPEVMSTEETIRFIVDNRCSISRFGDGEFDIIIGSNAKNAWQKLDLSLRQRLMEVLAYSDPKTLLVCIPPYNDKFNNLANYYRRFSFWEYYWLRNFSNLISYFNGRTFGNSFISRSTVFALTDLNLIKQLWAGREVVFVFGKGGRFDHNHHLFDNTSSHEIIHVSPTNAFDEYDAILSKCKSFSTDYTFLLAIGQTAAVLALDLAIAGYQALDIGHMPNCYDEYSGYGPRPESTPFIKM